MNWVTLSLTAAAMIGSLASTLNPKTLMPLYLSTFQIKARLPPQVHHSSQDLIKLGDSSQAFMMNWVTLSLTAAAMIGSLTSTLNPISLLPLFSSTFHHKCITLITSSQQMAKLRGEERRKLFSGGNFPLQVLLLNPLDLKDLLGLGDLDDHFDLDDLKEL